MAIDEIRSSPVSESTRPVPSRDREGAVFRILLLVAIGLLTGCRPPDLTGRTEEEPPQLSTEVQVADSSASAQLLSGWYSVERNSWRWTARKFTVILRPPIGSAAKGATLNFSFTVPDVVIARLHSRNFVRLYSDHEARSRDLPNARQSDLHSRRTGKPALRRYRARGF